MLKPLSFNPQAKSLIYFNTQPNSLQPKQLRNGGFTLIELSLVVFLIGLMLLIAVPKVRDTMLSDGLKTTVNYLTGTARALRSDAVRNQVDYILRLDLDNNRVWTYSVDMTPEAMDKMKQRAFRLPDTVDLLDVSHFGKEKITDGEVLIRFSRKDYVRPAIVHLAQNDQCFTLVFEPFLSSVRTYDTYVDFRDQTVNE